MSKTGFKFSNIYKIECDLEVLELPNALHVKYHQQGTTAEWSDEKSTERLFFKNTEELLPNKRALFTLFGRVEV